MADKLENPLESNICGLCHSTPSKYTCPRCQLAYCSLACYKSDQHLECSEVFYKECILKEMELREKEEGKKSRKKEMEEILCRVQQDDECTDSDDSVDDLEERMQHVNLDSPEEIWENLTERERVEFERLIESGDIKNIIPVFDPWWNIEKLPLIEEINQVDDKGQSRMPKIKDVPLLSNIMTKKPNENIIFGLTNILYGYSCITRLYMGEWNHENAKSAVETLMAISTNLSQGQNFGSTVEAVETAQSLAVHLQKLSQDVILAAKSDVRKIMQHPKFILASLSEILRLTELGIESGLSKRQLFRACKKLEFYLSFVAEYGNHYKL